MKTISGWLFAGVLLAALIYLQLCNAPKPVPSINNEAYNRLLKQQTDTIAYYEELRKADSAATDLAVYKAEKAAAEQQQAEADLQVSKDQVTDLTALVRSYRNSGAGVWVPNASPGYSKACDSLAVAADKLNEKINLATVANSGLRVELKYAKMAYEQELKTEKNYNLSLKNQLADCNKVVKDSSGSEKRTQVYAGFNLIGNKTHFINGGFVSLTLLTKRNTMFEGNVGLFNNEIYYGAGTKLLISFRRKR